MSDPVRELYSKHRYPALSHPETHPALLAVAARFAGLTPAAPDDCRVLEIGCASGHNLLPLAAAYPASRFVGIDFSDLAIRRARQAAEAVGLDNVRFEHADLAEWQPGEDRFDYLVAHGMLSWIPAPQQESLLRLAATSLDAHGVACLSYNTLPGWSLRSEAAAMIRALRPLTPASGDSDALLGQLTEIAGLGEGPYAAHLASLFEDMRRKGAAILPFDELAPVCEPFHFARLVERCAGHRLRYLGESTLPANFPPGLSPEALPKLRKIEHDPLLLQQAIDLFSGRSHRCSLFAPADAALETVDPAVTLDTSVRCLEAALPPEALPGELIELFHASLVAASPSTRSVRRLMEDCAARLGPRWEPGHSARHIAAWLFQAARLGWVELSAHERDLEPVPPERPALSPLNLHFAGRGEALVDAHHRSCHFPDAHRKLVALLDGTRSHAELAERARELAPDLHLEPWLVHLASRGLFSRP